jgi:hypothetical protein
MNKIKIRIPGACDRHNWSTVSILGISSEKVTYILLIHFIITPNIKLHLTYSLALELKRAEK